MTIEADLRPTIFSRLKIAYEDLRGWSYGQPEWLRRIEVVDHVGDEAIKMDREGVATQTIFDFIRTALKAQNIGSKIIDNPIHPLADYDHQLYPKAVLAPWPGMDSSHNPGGWLVYTAGDAKVADNPELTQVWQSKFDSRSEFA